jgi:plastocyanin
MRSFAALALIALSSLTIASCGGDESTTASRDETTDAVETVKGLRGDVATGGGGRVSTVGKGASEIRVVGARQGLAYETQEVTIEAGETLLHFENRQSAPHDLDLEDADGKLIADMETIGNGYADVPIRNLEPGEYTFYCSVPGHREAGMEGTVTVE